MKFDIGMILIK